MARNPPTGADGDHASFCRICEAFCGIVATVEHGRVTAVRPDRANPHSQGHACIKAAAMPDAMYDPDRVTRPLKRVGGPGEFVAVSWDEALDDVAARLKAIRAEHGGDAIAGYLGNPTGYSTNAFSSFGAFLSLLGSKKLYGAGSQDSAARLTAFFMVHGGPHYTAIPDLVNCDFLLMLGANPMVSNGWMVWNPRWKHDLETIAARGRVVVGDPRATETASRHEHWPIRPDGDVWLLIGVMRVLFDARLVDRTRIAAQCEGLGELEAAVASVDPATIVERTGLAWERIDGLARDFAAAERAVVYGGLGLCRGPFGTLAAYLSSVLNAITGRYGAPGGVRFSRQVLSARGRNRVGGHGERRTRIGGVPTIANKMAMAMLPADIEEPGEGRVRALVISAGNPVVSGPGGQRLERALEQLELLVSFDLYQTETNAHAHYILPVTSFLERADWPMIGYYAMLRPFLQYTDAVVPPVGDVRDDYAIYSGITTRMGIGPANASPRKREQARYGLLPDPVGQMDRSIRLGPVGDKLGLRPEGWSRERLRDHPSGVMVDDMPDDPTDWPARIGYPDGKLRIWHPLADGEMARLHAVAPRPQGTLMLIGRRDIRSINSWMHNVDRLVRSQVPALAIHPTDAAARGIAEGNAIDVSNANGTIRVVASVTDAIVPGTIAYPQGWGHRAGWRRANATPGANVNVLLGLGVESVEFVSGMTLIDCLDVTVTRTEKERV